MMVRTICRAIPAFVASFVLAGCGGGGGGSVPPISASPSAQQQTQVSFRIVIPRTLATSGAKMTRQYVSAGTQSITVNNQSFNTSATAPNCSTTSNGIACAFQIQAPVGPSVYFTVTTFDQPLGSNGNPQGNQLSTGTTTAAIVAGANNVVKVTLAGTPAKVNLTLANPSPPMGTAASVPLTVDARDADGYAIVGTYSSAIQLTTSALLSFTVNGTAASGSGLVSSSSDTASLVYSGSGVRSATIQANLQFAAAGTFIGSVAFTPTPSFGSEKTVGTSLVNASAWRDSSYQHTTWYTEPAKAMVAEYPQGGSTTEYPVPSGSAPMRITALVDEFYFTESNNRIGSVTNITPQNPGVVEHVLTKTGANAYEVQPTPLGLGTPQVFITEPNVGDIAVEGAPDTLYSTGTTPSTPSGIAFASDSSFWYTDPAADTIGLITTLGGITQYHVPSVGAQPTEITQNDQNQSGTSHWWFTEPGVSKIASLDANGNIMEYPSPGVPVAIVATQTDVFVLTTMHVIEDYNTSNGTLLGTFTPPSSSNGPAVWIDDGGPGDLIVLRSNGTNGSIQEFYYD